MCGGGDERRLGSLIYIEKGGMGCWGGDGMRKIKIKEGCVFEKVMREFRDLNVEVRCFFCDEWDFRKIDFWKGFLEV